MTKVGSYMERVRLEHGPKVAKAFYWLMVWWDGSPNVTQAFYNEDLLDMKLGEALESCQQEV